MSKELTDQQGTQHTALEMSAVSGNPPPKYSVNTHPASNFAYKMLEFSQTGAEKGGNSPGLLEDSSPHPQRRPRRWHQGRVALCPSAQPGSQHTEGAQ